MRIRLRHVPWPFIMVLFMLVACSGEDDLLEPGAAQGIEGTVLLGPQCPVQSLEDPCPDLPYEAWVDVRSADGESVTRIRSGEDGRFRIGLRPGQYVLDPESGDPFPIAGEQEVEVGAGAYVEVEINFDTGIR